MAALEASVEAAKSSRKRHPDGDDDGKAKAKKSAERTRRRAPKRPTADEPSPAVDAAVTEFSCPTSTRCSTRRGSPRAEVIEYYAHRAGDACRTSRPGVDVQALPERHGQARGSSRSAARPSAGWVPMALGRATATGDRVLLPRRAGGARVGGNMAALELHADGAGGRPRHAATPCSTSTRARHRHHRLLRDRVARATSSPPSTWRAGRRRPGRRACSCTCR